MIFEFDICRQAVRTPFRWSIAATRKIWYVGQMQLALLITIELAFVSCVTASEKPLSQGQLFELFGTVAPELRWTKKVGPDFEIFVGRTLAPDRGEVGVYIGFWPAFERNRFDDTFEGQVGAYRVKWHRKLYEDGSIRQEAVIGLKNDGLQAHVWIRAERQSDVDNFTKELSRFTRFRRVLHEETSRRGQSLILTTEAAFR